MNADLRAKMNIASNEAIKTISNNYGVSIETVENAIESQNEKILKEYIKLLVIAKEMFLAQSSCESFDRHEVKKVMVNKALEIIQAK